MKEVLTKKFWQAVKKTFEDAQLDEPPTQVHLSKEVSNEGPCEPKPGEPRSAAQTGIHAADTPDQD